MNRKGRAMEAVNPQACLSESTGARCKICARPLEVQKLRFPFGDRKEWSIPLVCVCVLEQRRREEAARQRQARVELLRRRGFEGGKYAGMTFENWREGNVDSSVLEAVVQYGQTVELSDRNWLYLHGNSGLGKTHLAVAAARAISLDRGWSPAIVSWPRYCGQIQQSWTHPGADVDRYLVKEAVLLVLEDMDRRAGTDWALGELSDVIDVRYQRNLPTILTANRSIQELSDFWNQGKAKAELCRAIISRMMGQLTKIVPIQGADYRLQAG